MPNYPYYLLLGANLGDRLASLVKATKRIDQIIGKVQMSSRIYETEPWGYEEQPWFLNQALKVQSDLSPEEVLKRTVEIEKELGREESPKWHARHLDIDILLWGSEVIETETLRIPHPHLAKRNFALLPLIEIAAEAIHPELGMTIEELFDFSRNEGDVYLFDPYDTK